MTKDEEESVLSNTKLIIYVLKKLHLKITEDNISIGKIGLIKAAMKWDCTKNVKFNTFAYTVIKNTLLMSLRHSHEKELSMSNILNDNSLDLLEAYTPPEDESIYTSEYMYNLCYTYEITDNLKKILQELPSEYSQIVKYRLKNMSQVQISNKLGINQTIISRRLRKIKTKLLSKLKER